MLSNCGSTVHRSLNGQHCLLIPGVLMVIRVLNRGFLRYGKRVVMSHMRNVVIKSRTE